MVAEGDGEFQEKLRKIASGNLDIFRQTTDEFLQEVESDKTSRERGYLKTPVTASK
jgi:hypothetical protein